MFSMNSVLVCYDRVEWIMTSILFRMETITICHINFNVSSEYVNLTFTSVVCNIFKIENQSGDKPNEKGIVQIFKSLNKKLRPEC